MALEWLKEILGDSYTEEINKKVRGEIGKAFVAKTDFDAKNTELKTANDTLSALQDTVKKFDGVDLEKLKNAAADAQKKYDADLASYKKDSAIHLALVQAKARNPKAARALIDDSKVTLNADGSLAGMDLDAIKKSDPYLFDVEVKKDEGTDGGAGGIDETLDKGFLAGIRGAMGLESKT
ncbi:MAG: phage scaffolding protein [Clostridia bacterium]